MRGGVSLSCCLSHVGHAFSRVVGMIADMCEVFLRDWRDRLRWRNGSYRVYGEARVRQRSDVEELRCDLAREHLGEEGGHRVADLTLHRDRPPTTRRSAGNVWRRASSATLSQRFCQ
jgi:hypothetical protein